jgi:hypothetical protein
MSDILQKLSEPFPREVERSLTKGGTSLTYIPVSEVITRLNTVLGIENWSYEVRDCHRDAVDSDWAIAHVRLTAVIDSNVVYKDGFGGQKIKRMKNGDPVDLGDEMKGAVSDALKKAAQALGVGLYLARSDESLQLEQEVAEEEALDPAIKAAWEAFTSVAATLDGDQKAKLNEFWVEFSDDRPKPQLDTATVADLTALSEEAIRLSFNAEYVEKDENDSDSSG